MKLAILDRDGVINEDLGKTVISPDAWKPLPGSLEAIARLHQSGWHVAVATNQSGIARGLLDLDTLHAVHRRMHELVKEAGGRIDVVAFCPHKESDSCNCRKPAPGMLYTIAERLDVALPEIVLIGDSLRDVQAAMAAAARPMIVRTGKGQRTLDGNKGLEHIPAHDDLAACVEAILSEGKKGE